MKVAFRSNRSVDGQNPNEPVDMWNFPHTSIQCFKQSNWCVHQQWQWTIHPYSKESLAASLMVEHWHHCLHNSKFVDELQEQTTAEVQAVIRHVAGVVFLFLASRWRLFLPSLAGTKEGHLKEMFSLFPNCCRFGKVLFLMKYPELNEELSKIGSDRLWFQWFFWMFVPQKLGPRWFSIWKEHIFFTGCSTTN